MYYRPANLTKHLLNLPHKLPMVSQKEPFMAASLNAPQLPATILMI